MAFEFYLHAITILKNSIIHEEGTTKLITVCVAHPIKLQNDLCTIYKTSRSALSAYKDTTQSGVF